MMAAGTFRGSARTWALVAIAVLGAAASVVIGAVVGAPVEGVVIGLSIAAAALLFDHPRAAMVVWLLSVAALPFWVGVDVVAYLAPTSIVGLVVLPSALRAVTSVRPTVADVIAGAFLVACIIPGLAGWSLPGDLANAVLQWSLGFLIGRLLAHRAGIPFTLRAISVVMAVVAALAILESAFSFNPWVLLAVDNRYFDVWSEIQMRGGIARAEGAFGHSIALGTSLAISMPLIAAGPLSKRWRLIILGLVSVAVFLTFSRAAIGGLLLVVVAILVLTPAFLSRRERLVGAAVVAVGALGGGILLVRVLDAAGNEAAGSAAYRGQLLELVGSMRPWGLAANYQPSGPEAVTTARFGDFESIDSGIIGIGVRFGWIPMVIAVVGLLIVIASILLLRTSALTAALLGSLVTVATTAFITQYGMYLWFVIGLVALAQGTVPRPRAGIAERYRSVWRDAEGRGSPRG